MRRQNEPMPPKNAHSSQEYSRRCKLRKISWSWEWGKKRRNVRAKSIAGNSYAFLTNSCPQSYRSLELRTSLSAKNCVTVRKCCRESTWSWRKNHVNVWSSVWKEWKRPSITWRPFHPKTLTVLRTCFLIIYAKLLSCCGERAIRNCLVREK